MYYIGIDLGGTKIGAGLVTADGRITHKAAVPTLLERGAEPIIEDMAKLCHQLIADAGISINDIIAVGIGVPGIANNDTGEVIYCTNLKWQHVQLSQIMKKYIDKPIYMENDATVAGLAESVAGASKGATNSLFLTLGTGLGGGVVIDGKVYSGSHHVGSELGHMIVMVGGRPCNCGNKGCWERYASATALINDGVAAMLEAPDCLIYKESGGDPAKVTAKTVVDAAKAGDAVGVKVFKQYVEYLSSGIISLVNMFDPEVIVLGGGMSAAGDFLLGAVRELVYANRFYKDLPVAEIRLSTMGNDAGIIGAAMMGRTSV